MVPDTFSLRQFQKYDSQKWCFPHLEGIIFKIRISSPMCMNLIKFFKITQFYMPKVPSQFRQNVPLYDLTVSCFFPWAPLRYFSDGGGGVQQRFIISTPKNPNFRIFLPQKIPTFLAYPQKSHINSKLHLNVIVDLS